MNYITIHNFINVIDISITAVFIYAALTLLRKTKSIFIFRGIAVLVIVYVVAAFLNLKLTTALFNGFFSFFVIILVVLFQKELRRFFENFSVSFFNPFGEEEIPIHKESINVIINSVQYFAKKKIGALIVLAGKQHVERYLDGGYVLDGQVSEPLILSIFDTRTPGHDGAVLIDNGLIKKFGAHLPLSENFRKFGNLGTRHTAALGLSERSDALIIVVSEERGTITLARNSNLKIVNAEQLKIEISHFLDELAPPEKEENIILRIFKYNKRDKIISVIVALLLRILLIKS
ncbi:MAG: diadenylate cyclase [Candidatus Vogelbacteria bacterium]|nr:diadenylate cyclase [Candidatus Vogelbacteria bacterium]